MSFFSRMASAGSSMARKSLGEPVTHYPAGNRSAGVTIEGVIVDRSEQTGGAVRITSPTGTKIPQQAVLTLLRTVTVTASTDPTRASIFTFDSLDWYAEKVLGVEGDDQHVQVLRTQVGTTKPNR